MSDRVKGSAVSSGATNPSVSLEGVLAVNKPAGFTSHDVVAKARRILGMKRIGHTGTLDPQVTGVLPLCLGKATRVVEYIQELPKEYEAELTIGYATDTEDWTGQETDRVDQVSLNKERLIQVLQSFIGTIQQVPPMYSAIKVDGKRLYELARQGQEIERSARTVHIYALELKDEHLEKKYPTVRIRVRCSKGTYIRTLCVDIGRALGYPSVMSELIRTSTGNITLARCLSLSEIEQLQQQGKLNQYLIQTDQAIAHIPRIDVNDEEALHASQGKSITVSLQELDTLESLQAVEDQNQLVRVYGPEERFIGIFRKDPEQGILRPEKVFV
jgi:tRNA pseudouridine55 synthase